MVAWAVADRCMRKAGAIQCTCSEGQEGEGRAGIRGGGRGSHRKPRTVGAQLELRQGMERDPMPQVRLDIYMQVGLLLRVLLGSSLQAFTSFF